MHPVQAGRTRTAKPEGTLGADPDFGRKIVRERVCPAVRGTYVIKPTARPIHAPIAIVGRKIPAGIYKTSDFSKQSRNPW